MNKILIIGSVNHEEADTVEWTQQFCCLEKYDCMIIDLTSFPKNYPPSLFNNIGALKKAVKLLINENKTIFCLMEKPFKILFKKIPLNYSWMPFPHKLTVYPMLLGKTMILIDQRFSEYMETVELWDNELYWKNTKNCTFENIAINKSGNSIATTISVGNRGRIHLLPKPSKNKKDRSVKLLIDIAKKKEPREYPWLKSIDVPKLGVDSNISDYRNLFSRYHENRIKSLQTILEDLGIKTRRSTEFDLTDVEGRLEVKVISTPGKVDAQQPIFKQMMDNVKIPTMNKKIVLITNTYQILPPEDRIGKKHLDPAIKILFETNNAVFLSTLSIFNLWKKVITGQISAKESSWLIRNESGEIEV